MAPPVKEEEPGAEERIGDDLILLAFLLLRLGASYRRSASARLAVLQEEVLREVAPVDLSGPARRITMDRLGGIVLELTRTAYREIDAELRAELIALAGLISSYMAGRISEELGVPGAGMEVQPPILEEAATGAMIEGAILAAWLSRQAGDLVFRLHRVIADTAANGLGPTETISGIREAFRSADRNFSPVIRSGITAVFSSVMLAVIERNGGALGGWIHVSILDGATTTLCRSRAGRRWRINRKPIGHSMPFRIPPLHIGCRSHIAPLFRPLAEMPPTIQRQVREAGRAHDFAYRDRPEPSLEQWLRRQPESRQRVIVGRRKWEEWRAGRITVSALLDQAGRPLTLDQVRRALGL